MNNFGTMPNPDPEADKKIMLDNEAISYRQFNDKLSSLKSNQRIIETQDNHFFTIERFHG